MTGELGDLLEFVVWVVLLCLFGALCYLEARRDWRRDRKRREQIFVLPWKDEDK